MKLTKSPVLSIKPPVARTVGYFSSNWRVWLVAAFFVAGLGAGSIAVRGYVNGSDDILNQIVGGFIHSRQNQTVFQTLFNSLASSVPLLVCTYIFGLCAVGMPMVPLVALFRGLGLGVSMGYLYSAHSLGGIMYCLLIIIPPAIISTLVIIFSGREALRFSYLLFGLLFKKGGSSPNSAPDFRKYSLRFCVFLLFLVAAAIADAFFSMAFSKFFSF